jgi:hypothetical protein
MNEYEVTLNEDDGRERKIVVEAETAVRARDQAEDETGAEAFQVRFVRALAFSCRMRGAS